MAHCTGAKINLKHNPISLTFQERNRFRVTEKALKKQKKSTIKSSGIMQSREVWIEKQKAFYKTSHNFISFDHSFMNILVAGRL